MLSWTTKPTKTDGERTSKALLHMMVRTAALGPIDDQPDVGKSKLTSDRSLPSDIIESIKDQFSDEKQEPSRILHNPQNVHEFLLELKKPETNVNMFNCQGDTPLHSLVKRIFITQQLKFDLLITLLVYSDVDINLPSGYGNTALHMAVEGGDMRIIKLLLSFGAKINALNSHNKTPLDLIQGPYRFYHRQGSIAKIPEISSPIDEDIFYDALGYQPTSPESKSFVRRRSSLISPVFEEVQNMVAFLKDHGAVRGREITARVCNTCSVKAFPDVSEREKKTSIESDASLNSPLQRLKMYEHTLSDDWATQIPRLFFQLSKTIEAKLYDLTHSLRHNTDESVALATQIKEMKMLRQAGSRILFLDGGGLRGLIQTEILSQLEEQTGRQITELFDWFVGTSTGGILALGFVYAKKSVKEMRQMYHRLKQEVIDKPRLGLAFNTEGFEKMLREEFGDICMNEVKHPRVLVTAVDKSCVNLKLRFFNNCFDDEYSSETVWKVARYTSAAPASFTELDNYVDGGVLANNPGSSGLTRIQNFYRSQKQRLPISLVVSVGTGREPDAELGRSDFQNFLYFGNHWFSMSDTLSSRIGNLSTLLSQAITNSDEVAENLHSRCLEQGIPCYRLDPKLKTKITMGETDDDKLIDMILQCKTNVIDQPQFASLVLQFHQCSQAVRRMSRYT